ncbi:uncharacterized protein LOC129581227 [Paramacrobiotus metropolitanus]|uniref:uncharacterized protein LOC129581227 n=1 Tax=Paramacrobiotus metropolitanus TaxID=2943436 RepID=UPI002445F40D|nr:uncharacterized protein LOC129581227 [Paramacrobiotus metropolitanus]
MSVLTTSSRDDFFIEKTAMDVGAVRLRRSRSCNLTTLADDFSQKVKLAVEKRRLLQSCANQIRNSIFFCGVRSVLISVAILGYYRCMLIIDNEQSRHPKSFRVCIALVLNGCFLLTISDFVCCMLSWNLLRTMQCGSWLAATLLSTDQESALRRVWDDCSRLASHMELRSMLCSSAGGLMDFIFLVSRFYLDLLFMDAWVAFLTGWLRSPEVDLAGREFHVVGWPFIATSMYSASVAERSRKTARDLLKILRKEFTPGYTEDPPPGDLDVTNEILREVSKRLAFCSSVIMRYSYAFGVVTLQLLKRKEVYCIND